MRRGSFDGLGKNFYVFVSPVSSSAGAAASSSVSSSHFHRFCLITFEGMYGFHSNFAELYITIKYRSSSILVIIRKILAELWPFFDLLFVVRFNPIIFEGMH